MVAKPAGKGEAVQGKGEGAAALEGLARVWDINGEPLEEGEGRGIIQGVFG